MLEFVSTLSSSYDPLQLVGIFFLTSLASRVALSLWRGIYSNGLAYWLGRGVDWTSVKGQWAVITGASEGIGREYARQLAEKGFNIVLISRTRQKLEKVAQEIESEHRVQTKIITADFKDHTIYPHIRLQLQELQVGVLVNNVGTCYSGFEYFNDLPNREQFVSDMVSTNVYSALMMTEIILPQMESLKSGVIINLSSIIGLQPFPLCTVYAATKAFLDNLSNGLNEEYKSKGIVIQSVTPAGVKTGLSEAMGTSIICTPSDSYVRWTLRTVGLEDSTFGHPFHKLQGFLLELQRTYLFTSVFLKTLYYMGIYIRRTNKNSNRNR